MGKINLAKQNQYVEFAKKDDEGNSISEGFKTIGEAIEGLEQDIEGLEQDIEGKVVFDGSISVETIGGDKGIRNANLPTTAGTYKLSSGGVLSVKANSASSITITAMYGASMYAETRDPASTSDFLFNENTRLGDKPIYCHPIYATFNRPVDNRLFTFTCLLFNNEPTAYTPATFFAFCKELFTLAPTASIMASGYTGTFPISRIINGSTDTTLKVENVNLDRNNVPYNDAYVFEVAALSGGTFIDGVNRIN